MPPLRHPLQSMPRHSTPLGHAGQRKCCRTTKKRNYSWKICVGQRQPAPTVPPSTWPHLFCLCGFSSGHQGSDFRGAEAVAEADSVMSCCPSHIINVLIRTCAAWATLVRATWPGDVDGCGRADKRQRTDCDVERGCVSTTCCGPKHVGKWKAAIECERDH